MSRENFAPEFKTPEQYIIDITYIIWEEGEVGRILDWYTPICPTRHPHGVMDSAEDMVDESLEQMHIFTNRKPLADDVIIGDKTHGFYSSHRVRSIGRHMGDSVMGPASKRSYQGLGIADCLCRDNRIVEEWKLRDQAGFVRQLGIDPIAYGISLGEKKPEVYTIGNDAMRERWVDKNGQTILGDEAIAKRMLDAFDQIWNKKQFNLITEKYLRSVRLEGPDGLLSYGRDTVHNRIASMMASIPDGKYEAHHVIVQQKKDRAVRVAVRWSYCGNHKGFGRYGKPTGCPVAILGISHFELQDDQIASEWMVVDETAIHAQIAAYKQIGD